MFVRFDQVLTDLVSNQLLRVQERLVDPDPFTIESMRSQEYSVFIFCFLVVGIMVFAGVIYWYMRTTGDSKLKLGEKIMFGCIIMGMIVAVAFGATQLLYGYLI